MKRILTTLAALAIAGVASADTVVFSNGLDLWTGSSTGGGFTNTAALTNTNFSDGNAVGIVGIGQRSNGEVYATGNNGNFYRVANITSSSPTFTLLGSIAGGSPSTISFDFFDDGLGGTDNILRGVRGGEIIEFDVENITTTGGEIDLDSSVSNAAGSGFPATARIGTDYFGVKTSDRKVYEIGSAGSVGDTGLTDVFVQAGGSSEADGRTTFFMTAGFDGTTDAQDRVRFGFLDQNNGWAFTQLGANIDVGALTNNMGMTILIPLPTSAPMVTAGLLGMGFCVRRRRETA